MLNVLDKILFTKNAIFLDNSKALFIKIILKYWLKVIKMKPHIINRRSGLAKATVVD